MKRFLLVFSAVMLLSKAASAETITLVADSWCPYNCDESSENQGFIVDIARKAFGRHGMEIEYKTMPWTRAIEDTRAAKYTAIVGASKNDAPDFIFPDIEQGRMKNSFYVLKSSQWKYTGIDSLAAISFGAIKDYSYGDTLDTYIQSHRGKLRFVQLVYGENPLELNVKKLLAGRIDAVLEDERVMNAYLAENKLRDKLAIAGSLADNAQSKLFVAFSPLSPHAKKYADLLSQEMAAMRASGELKAILDKYEITDWRDK